MDSEGATKDDTASDPPRVPLKDPGFAAILGWLWPGAGHLYQGRTAKGVLFMVCILATFFYGEYLGQGRVVFLYGKWKPERFRWPYLCQMWVGVPALPAVVQTFRSPQFNDELFGRNRWYMPPQDAAEFNLLHKHLHHFFELGTVFTMIAGLLNVLAIYDAWGGPAYLHEKRPDDETEDAKEEEPAAVA